ncbi:MAG: hypothetical protein WCR67_03130, partial [Bacilli bacterium]
MANQISVSVTYKNNYTYLFYLCDSYYRYLTNPNEQNAYSFIKEIVVSNDSETDYRNLELLFSIDSEVVRVDKILIDELLPKSKIQITKFIKAYLDALQLYKISEAIPCQMRVDLLADNGSAVLFSDVLSFIISPIADSVQNSKNEELFPCYVTPNSDEVSQVVSKANISLKKLRPNEPAFIGYQANDIDSVRMEMMAVYNALSESGINYSNPPAFFNQYNRVRLADQVLKEKRGTCLDLALLYCSVLESVGLNPILILVDRHAFAGCFLEKECGFENMLCTDASRVYNSSVVGNMKIELVECTGFPQSSQMSFSQSTQTARKNLAFYNGSFTAIDIHTAHKGIYRPVPTLLTDENGHQSADIAFSANNEFQTKNIEGNGVVFDGKTTEDKFSYWSKKLLDLTLKNKLINFTIGGSTIQVLVDDVSVYLKQILSGNIFISPNGIKPLKNELVIMDQQ